VGLLDDVEGQSLSALLLHPEQALTALSACGDSVKQTPTNRHVFLSAVVAYLTHCGGDSSGGAVDSVELLRTWKAHQRENWEPLSEHYANHEPTALQRDKAVIPYQQILQCRDALERGSFERLLLSFYTMMEPLRADYFATEIVHGGGSAETAVAAVAAATEENILVLLSPTSVELKVRDFKTKHRHPVIENSLPLSLIRELHASLDRYPRRYLFVKEDKRSPFTRKEFSSWACSTLSRVLRQPMTLTVLRHLYITEKVAVDTPLADMKEIAKKMGHSRGMQRAYEWG
jgi:hypothetical protein